MRTYLRARHLLVEALLNALSYLLWLLLRPLVAPVLRTMERVADDPHDDLEDQVEARTRRTHYAEALNHGRITINQGALYGPEFGGHPGRASDGLDALALSLRGYHLHTLAPTRISGIQA